MWSVTLLTIRIVSLLVTVLIQMAIPDAEEFKAADFTVKVIFRVICLSAFIVKLLRDRVQFIALVVNFFNMIFPLFILDYNEYFVQ